MNSWTTKRISSLFNCSPQIDSIKHCPPASTQLCRHLTFNLLMFCVIKNYLNHVELQRLANTRFLILNPSEKIEFIILGSHAVSYMWTKRRRRKEKESNGRQSEYMKFLSPKNPSFCFFIARKSVFRLIGSHRTSIGLWLTCHKCRGICNLIRIIFSLLSDSWKPPQPSSSQHDSMWREGGDVCSQNV